MPKEYPRSEKPSISSAREIRGWNYPKNFNIMCIRSWAHCTFLWYFCFAYAIFFMKRFGHSDIKQRQRNAHPLTPFHPQSPILECIRCQIKSFHSCGRNAAVSFGAVKWRLWTTFFYFEHPFTQPFRPHPFHLHLLLKYTGRILKNLFWEGRHLRPSLC